MALLSANDSSGYCADAHLRATPALRRGPEGSRSLSESEESQDDQDDDDGADDVDDAVHVFHLVCGRRLRESPSSDVSDAQSMRFHASTLFVAAQSGRFVTGSVRRGRHAGRGALVATPIGRRADRTHPAFIELRLCSLGNG